MTKILVAYFSASGTTAHAAQEIATVVGADMYAILPTQPYTTADLNWTNKHSRSSREMNDPASRPEIVGKVENIDQYAVIWLGFPLWWGVEPRIVDTFLESYDFSGKVMIPFATSGGSDISNAIRSLQVHCPQANWQSGKVVNSKAGLWAESLLRG